MTPWQKPGQADLTYGLKDRTYRQQVSKPTSQRLIVTPSMSELTAPQDFSY